MSIKGHDSKQDELLDHEADGIREFDNALPRWWLYGFYVTIVFAVIYAVNYHVLPAPVFGYAGMVAEYQAELEAARRAAPAPRAGDPADGVLVALTDTASLARGKAIFEGPDNVCSSCQRLDLGGMVGPNLTDDSWLHGCTVKDIVTSIKTGYPLKGMLPFGTGKLLADDQVLLVASYVIAKRGSAPADPKPAEPERDAICR
jgi:cytochrome c oxidase cbb3-type subunit 3